MLEIPIVHPPRFTYFPQFNKFLSNSWASITADEAADKADKAAKSDDAAPVFRHWYDRITGLFPLAEPLIRPLQRALMHWHRRRFFREFLTFLDTKYGPQWPRLLHLSTDRNAKAFQGGGVVFSRKTRIEFHKDRKLGLHVLDTYLNSTFLHWDKGSTLILWRWHPELQTIARDGFYPYICGHLPRNKKRPRPIQHQQCTLFFSKIKKVYYQELHRTGIHIVSYKQ